MQRFISCDWGSTRFRLRLVDVASLNVLLEICAEEGIRVLYDQWKSGNDRHEDRQLFFSNYLLAQIETLKKQANHSLEKIPVMISGMASSNIGLKELAYKVSPIKTDGTDLIVDKLSFTEKEVNPVYLISGVCTDMDVARGEETMMVGCDYESSNTYLCIFPGTHSKHILIQNSVATNIQSFMTGEIFQLLSVNSILVNSIRKPKGYEASTNEYFNEGVRKGSTTNFLNSVFQVRINDLLKKASAEENYCLLMGMLIGHELKDIQALTIDKLILVCSEELNAAYLQAIKILCPDLSVICVDAGAALIRGQWKVLQSLIKE